MNYDTIVKSLEEKRNVFLYGQFGSGQTKLLKQVESVFLGKKDTIPIYINTENIFTFQNPISFYILKHYSNLVSTISNNEFISATNLLSQSFKKSRYDVILLVDFSSMLLDEIQLAIIKELNSYLCIDNITCVFSSSTKKLYQNRIFNDFKYLYIEPLSKTEVIERLKEEKINDSYINKKWFEIICIPLFLDMFCAVYKNNTTLLLSNIGKGVLLDSYFKKACRIESILETSNEYFETLDFFNNALPHAAYFCNDNSFILPLRFGKIINNASFLKVLSHQAEGLECSFDNYVARNYFLAKYYSNIIFSISDDNLNILNSTLLPDELLHIIGELLLLAYDRDYKKTKAAICHFIDDIRNSEYSLNIAIYNLLTIAKFILPEQLSGMDLSDLDLHLFNIAGVNCNKTDFSNSSLQSFSLDEFNSANVKNVVVMGNDIAFLNELGKKVLITDYDSSYKTVLTFDNITAIKALSDICLGVSHDNIISVYNIQNGTITNYELDELDDIVIVAVINETIFIESGNKYYFSSKIEKGFQKLPWNYYSSESIIYETDGMFFLSSITNDSIITQTPLKALSQDVSSSDVPSFLHSYPATIVYNNENNSYRVLGLPCSKDFDDSIYFNINSSIISISSNKTIRTFEHSLSIININDRLFLINFYYSFIIYDALKDSVLYRSDVCDDFFGYKCNDEMLIVCSITDNLYNNVVGFYDSHYYSFDRLTKHIYNIKENNIRNKDRYYQLEDGTIIKTNFREGALADRYCYLFILVFRKFEIKKAELFDYEIHQIVEEYGSNSGNNFYGKGVKNYINLNLFTCHCKNNEGEYCSILLSFDGYLIASLKELIPAFNFRTDYINNNCIIGIGPHPKSQNSICFVYDYINKKPIVQFITDFENLMPVETWFTFDDEYCIVFVRNKGYVFNTALDEFTGSSDLDCNYIYDKLNEFRDNMDDYLNKTLSQQDILERRALYAHTKYGYGYDEYLSNAEIYANLLYVKGFISIRNLDTKVTEYLKDGIFCHDCTGEIINPFSREFLKTTFSFAYLSEDDFCNDLGELEPFGRIFIDDFVDLRITGAVFKNVYGLNNQDYKLISLFGGLLE